MRYRFGIFDFDAAKLELRRDGHKVVVQGLPLRLLALLLEGAGSVVTRDSIRDALWADSTHREFDNSLSQAVHCLQDALGDSVSNPRFIATVPGHGYRFIAPIYRSQPVGPAPDIVMPEPAMTGMAIRHLLTHRLVLWTLGLLILLVMALGLAYRTAQRMTEELAARATPPRLAVLPFETLGDRSDEYLSEGLTEALISALGRYPSVAFDVIARNSIKGYKDRTVSLETIRRELDVAHVLKGAVRRVDDQVRITVDLIPVSGRTRLWSGSYDRPFRDLPALEREIAREILEALVPSTDGPEPLAASPISPQAYEFYLRGRQYLEQRTPESVRLAIEAFQHASDEAPRHAASYRSLGQAYVLQGDHDLRFRHEGFRRARSAIERALELDPQDAEAHVILGSLHLWEWDRLSAERAFDRAARLQPGLAAVHHWRGIARSAAGLHDSAIASLERALELDPLSLEIRADLAERQFFARRFDEAMETCRAVLELNPNDLEAVELLAWIHINQSQAAGALEAVRRWMELEGVGRSAESHGLEALLRDSIDFRRQRYETGGGSAYELALEYAALGEIEAALETLDLSFETREADLVMLEVDPRFDDLRREPRFGQLVQNIGLGI